MEEEKEKKIKNRNPKSKYRIVTDRPNWDLVNTKPLFRSYQYTINDRYCNKCYKSGWRGWRVHQYNTCECECHSNPAVNFYQMSVWIPENPVRTVPSESIYTIKIQEGIINMNDVDTCLSDTTQHAVCEFSVYDSIDEHNETMKELVKKYVKYTEPTEVFADFNGVKSRELYISYFSILINKIKEESIVNLGPKENPHMTIRKKIKK